MLVAVCLFSLHRRPDLWEEPDQFRSDRFLKPGVNEDYWLPFGAGPRKCIGQHFAMMEMQLVAAQLLNRFDYEVLHAEEIQPKLLITMGMDRPLLTSFVPAT
jgi:cytochrome P450